MLGNWSKDTLNEKKYKNELSVTPQTWKLASACLATEPMFKKHNDFFVF
jgi:hypothetical protein